METIFVLDAVCPCTAAQITVLRVPRPVEGEFVEYSEHLTDCNVLYVFSTAAVTRLVRHFGRLLQRVR